MYRIGEIVFHPLHGAGIIEGIESKKILNTTKQFYRIILPDSQLEEIYVPTSNANSLGLRYLIDKETIDEVKDILSEKLQLKIEEKWKDQFKKQEERVNSCDITKVAHALKFLFHKSLQKKLGSMDKWLLKKSKNIIASEIHFVESIDYAQALDMIDGWVKVSVVDVDKKIA
ncbi:MAG: hypothetical protein C0601_09650 [Candidatus Muiribacterium halophilum]|uniref:CarD-like/TRCF RNAP-interacting domain-containing protein n=1 Tax=Muiribacterium halophilum TaxID=2053465 RepID=A0A2N5ZDI9_MUIH1|nr:MAG: hypothetical protein C0601_09650 [Candidatus Muirbacterium halophilum]